MAGVSEGLMLFITPTFYASFDPLRKFSNIFPHQHRHDRAVQVEVNTSPIQ